MTTIQQGITTLLRCAITGQSLELPEDFQLENAIAMIRRHGITTLAYEGAVRCGLNQQLPVMKELFQSYYQLMLQSERQMRELNRIFTAFQERGICYLPLKGCNLKALYPRSELRLMGDADILIQQEQYREKVAPLMEELGYSYLKESEHDYTWTSKDLYLELHHCLIDPDNERSYAYFGTGWQLAQQDQGSRYALNPEDEFLFLLAHFVKHFRRGGIGCSHVVDLWVYLRSHPELQEEVLAQRLSAMGLLDLYRRIREMMAVWFEDGPADEKTEAMTAYIFNCGRWGTMENRIIADLLRNFDRPASRAAGKAAYLLERTFPKMKEMRHQYPILQKAPWLLPLTWLHRIVSKVWTRRGKLLIHLRWAKSINTEKLEKQSALLEAAGLDEKLK